MQGDGELDNLYSGPIQIKPFMMTISTTEVSDQTAHWLSLIGYLTGLMKGQRSLS